MIGPKPGIVAMGIFAASAAGCSEEVVAVDPMDETAIVFDTTVLHEIRIEVAPGDIEALELDHDNRVPCTVTFDGERLENAAIRQKGQGTQSGSLYTKPSFSIRFDELVPGQKLHGLNKLLLNNSDGDPSFLREQIGYDLYQRAGIPSRRTAHAVVTLVGLQPEEQSYGIHVMVEAVNNGYLTRQFGEDYDHGNLYEDENEGDFAGNPYGIDLKDDDDPGRTRDHLVEFSDFLYSEPGDDFIERLEGFIDLERALDSFAIDLVAQHSDGFWLAAHNYYMYDNPADGRFVLIPHGMDLLFGAYGECGVVPGVSEMPTSLGEVIVDNPVLRDRLRAAIDRVIDNVWDESLIEAYIDNLATLLDTAAYSHEAFEVEAAAQRASTAALRQLVRDADQVWRSPVESTCGDSVRDGRELCAGMCDDGNLISGDGCSDRCLVEFCGDGVTQPELGEVCDDEDDCNWDCQRFIVCGDGFEDGDELCDDGNQDNDDGCDNSCMPATR